MKAFISAFPILVPEDGNSRRQPLDPYLIILLYLDFVVKGMLSLSRSCLKLGRPQSGILTHIP
jgi:hypothetical protein